jgi:hypothetical protein
MPSENNPDQRQPIQMQEGQLREFIANGAVTRVLAIGHSQGFELHVHIGSAVGVLGNARGAIRTFSTLNTLVGLVKRLGSDRFEVEIGDFIAEETPKNIAPAKVAEISKLSKGRKK